MHSKLLCRPDTSQDADDDALTRPLVAAAGRMLKKAVKHQASNFTIWNPHNEGKLEAVAKTIKKQHKSWCLGAASKPICCIMSGALYGRFCKLIPQKAESCKR
jgi:hypothetical protein